MTSSLATFFIGLLLAAFVLVVFLNLFKLLFGYKITEHGVSIVLLHLATVHTIAFGKISKVRTAAFHEVALIPGIHLPSRLFGKRVVIETTGNSLFRHYFITPKDPEKFVEMLRKKIV